MGANKDYWIAECERADEAYLSSLDQGAFMDRMKELGFDEAEAATRLDGLKTDAGLSDD